jgi:hypothetical protein
VCLDNTCQLPPAVRVLCRPWTRQTEPTSFMAPAPAGFPVRFFFLAHKPLAVSWSAMAAFRFLAGSARRQSGNHERGASDVVAVPASFGGKRGAASVLPGDSRAAIHAESFPPCACKLMETGCCIVVATTVSLFRSVATRNGSYYLEHVMNTSSFLVLWWYCAISCESEDLHFV